MIINTYSVNCVFCNICHSIDYMSEYSQQIVSDEGHKHMQLQWYANVIMNRTGNFNSLIYFAFSGFTLRYWIYSEFTGFTLRLLDLRYVYWIPVVFTEFNTKRIEEVLYFVSNSNTDLYLRGD